MTKYSQLAEQHMMEYESCLKHIDELLSRANEDVTGEEQETASELKVLTSMRQELASHVEKMRLKSLDDWEEEERESRANGCLGCYCPAT